MAALVITDLGIALKSYQELRQEMREEWVETFGNAIDLSPVSVDGHHIDLECKTITSISQLLQAVVNNLDPTKARGVWLDILGDYKSMSRIKASYSVAKVTFSGAGGTVVPAGTIVRYDGAPCDFTLQDDVTIGASGVADGNCKANSIGYVEIFVGDWKMVSSSPQGVTCKVLQANDGGAGRDRETDTEFRARQKAYAGKGLATYDRMHAYMASVIGEGTFSLVVNEEDVYKNDVPPHRFEFIVNDGVGVNEDIAQAIWRCKPAGIKPFGNVSANAVDIVGNFHTMYFSRPVSEKLWLKISFTKYNEEPLPDDYEDAIKKAVEDFAATEFSPGKDVIPERFKGPIYKAVPGILHIYVKAYVGDSAPVSSDYTEDPIEVSQRSVAELYDTTVNLVTT